MTKRLPPLQAVPMSPNGTHAPDEADLSALDDLYPDAASQVRHTTVEMVEDSPRRWVPTLQLNTTVTGLIALAMVCAGWFGHAFFTPAPPKAAPLWVQVVTPSDERLYQTVAQACIKLDPENPRLCALARYDAEQEGVMTNIVRQARAEEQAEAAVNGQNSVVIEKRIGPNPGHASSPSATEAVPDTLPKTIGKDPV